MLAALYSSGSSGSAPFLRCISSSACFASKASEMYFRNIRPRTTCLYSAASILLRRPSAICHSLASKPRLAPVSAFDAVFPLDAIDCAHPPHMQAELHPRLLRRRIPLSPREITQPFKGSGQRVRISNDTPQLPAFVAEVATSAWEAGAGSFIDFGNSAPLG